MAHEVISAMVDALHREGVDMPYLRHVEAELLVKLSAAQRRRRIYADCGKMAIVDVARKWGCSRTHVYDQIHYHRNLSAKMRDLRTVH